jgi:hypothetical protein
MSCVTTGRICWLSCSTQTLQQLKVGASVRGQAYVRTLSVGSGKRTADLARLKAHTYAHKALWANCTICVSAVAGLAGILVMLTADPSKQPMESLACKRMAKAACNWVELMTGMMLWQHRMLPFVDLPAEASVAQMLLQQPRNTDREFHDFFTQVCPPMQTCLQHTSVLPAVWWLVRPGIVCSL